VTDPAESKGEVLASGLSHRQLLDVFRYMALARAAEERLEVLFKQGHIKGGLYRSLGQEGCAVGAAFALNRYTDGTGDIVGPTIRATGAVFLMGGTPLQFFRQYLARATGPTRGREANVHWCDFRKGLVGPVSPLGTMVEVMAGITLAFKVTEQPRVGMVFYGDGASSTGAWHEGFNFAAVQRCPMVLAFEANRWAFSTPTYKQSRVASFTEKAAGYGVEAESVDGNDVLAVLEASRRAVDRARTGGGVTLLEMRTYRRRGHAQHDPQDYVPPEEIEAWEANDPIDRYRARLNREGWAESSELDAIALEVEDECRVAAEQAVEEPVPEGVEALERVYTDVTISPPWTRMPATDPRSQPEITA